VVVAPLALTLAKVAEGTRLAHAGFVLPRTAAAFQNMSGGWKKVFGYIGAVAAEQ
jgi:hypothetical protein